MKPDPSPQVLFLHEHVAPSLALTFHFRDAAGTASRLSVTAWHALPTAVDCGRKGGGCVPGAHVPARTVKKGDSLLRAREGGGVEKVRLRVEGRGMRGDG